MQRLSGQSLSQQLCGAAVYPQPEAMLADRSSTYAAGISGAQISIACLLRSALSPYIRSLRIPIEKDNEFPPPTLLLLLCLLPPDSSWAACIGGWSRGGQGGSLLMATGHCCHGDLHLLDPLSTLLFLGLSDMHPSSCARAMTFRGGGRENQKWFQPGDTSSLYQWPLVL